jgi:hypothetical protein
VTRILSKTDLEGLDRLSIRIPDYKGSHPFSFGDSIKAYRPEELKKKRNTNSARTDWFERILFAIWREIDNRPVPFAFRTTDGAIRSMDAGCLGFLFNHTQPELVFQRNPDTGEIVTVEPTGRLKTRYQQLEASLRREVRPEIPIRSESAQGQTIVESSTTTPIEISILELSFNLDDPPDERRRELSERVIREGGAAFRKEQMELWAAQCAATGCAIKEALDAAHILRYLGEHTNRPDNGILLRADIHKLFDRNLIAVEERKADLVWRVSAILADSEYAILEGRRVALGKQVSAVPRRELLAQHLKELKS